MKNQVVMITGGAKGIGRACAEAFIQRGASVSLISRTAQELETAERALAASSGKVITFCGDISDPSVVDSWFQQTKKKLGLPRILVNNAATFLNKPATDQTLEDWEKVIRINLNGTFLCSQEFFKLAKDQPAPRAIVNMSSLAGIRGTEKFPGLSSYVASKFAVVGLTEALAVEGKPLNIRVNCIAPGAVDTEMLRRALPNLKAKAQPQDIAQIVLFLCDENQSSVITGSTIEVFSNL